MKGIMFNEHYGLESAVIYGIKTMTRRRLHCDVTPMLTNGLLSPEVEKYLIGKYSPYHVGDRIAIRQSYQTVYNWMRKHGATEPQLIDYELLHAQSPGWTNKMFVKTIEMPWQVEIQHAHIERLQEISMDDCLREGVHVVDIDTDKYKRVLFFVPGIHPNGKKVPTWDYNDEKVVAFNTARQAFASLICHLNGQNAWNGNSWQIVYSIHRIPADNPYFANYYLPYL